MSSIDRRVVSIEMDNQQFENAAKNTMATLDKLDTALQFKDSRSNVNGAVEGIQKSLNNINFSALESAIGKVNDGFSVMGVMAKRAIEDITDTIYGFVKSKAVGAFNATLGQIKSGGWARTSNIAQARHMLKGLGVAWEDVEESINYAVQDTAYGVDEASRIASQFLASGVEKGEAMSTALRAVSGTAAMTNSSYLEMGDIFAKVAGQGRVMAINLNQLAIRGLNGAATLAEYLGKTEAEVRALVSKGAIDFDTFAKAMDSAFGEHSKAANETFSGAAANIRAALSRIGQGFAEPYMASMTTFFQQVLTMTKMIEKAVKPISKAFEPFFDLMFGSQGIITSVVKRIRGEFSKFVDDKTLAGFMPTALKEAGQSTEEWVASMRKAYGEYRKIPFISQIESFIKKVEDFQWQVNALFGVEELDPENQLRFDQGIFKGKRFDDIKKNFTEFFDPIVKSLKKFFKLPTPKWLTKTVEAAETLEELLGKNKDDVDSIIRGDYGNGAERIKNLMAANKNYWELQDLVNYALTGRTTSLHELSDEELRNLGYTQEQIDSMRALYPEIEKTSTVMDKLAEMADRVISGEFGNGADRYDALTEAGENYWEIQDKVNEVLGLGIGPLNKLSDEQLRNLGYTQEQIDAMRALYATMTGQTGQTDEKYNSGIYGIITGVRDGVVYLLDLWETFKQALVDVLVIKQPFYYLQMAIINLGGAFHDIIEGITSGGQSGAYNFFYTILSIIADIIYYIANGIRILRGPVVSIILSIKKVIDVIIKHVLKLFGIFTDEGASGAHSLEATMYTIFYTLSGIVQILSQVINFVGDALDDFLTNSPIIKWLSTATSGVFDFIDALFMAGDAAEDTKIIPETDPRTPVEPDDPIHRSRFYLADKIPIVKKVRNYWEDLSSSLSKFFGFGADRDPVTGELVSHYRTTAEIMADILKPIREFFGYNEKWEKIEFADGEQVPIGRQLIDIISKLVGWLGKFNDSFKTTDEVTGEKKGGFLLTLLTTLGDLASFVLTTGGKVLDFFGNFIETITNSKGFKDFIKLLGDIGSTVAGWAGGIWDKIYTLFFGKKDDKDGVTGIAKGMEKLDFAKLGKDIGEKFGGALEWVSTRIDNFKKKLGSIKEAFATFFDKKRIILYDDNGNQISSGNKLLDFLDKLKAKFDPIKKWLDKKGILSGITKFFRDIGTALGFLNPFADDPKFTEDGIPIVPEFKKTKGNMVLDFLDNLKEKWKEIKDAVKNFSLSEFIASIPEKFSGLANWIGDAIKNTEAYKKVSEFLGSTFEKIKYVFEDILGFFSGLFSKFTGKGEDGQVNSIGDVVTSALGSKKIIESTEDVANEQTGILGRIRNFFVKIIDAFKWIIDTFREKGFFGFLGELFKKAFTMMSLNPEDLSNGFLDTIKNIGRAIQNAGGSLIDAITPVLETLGSAIGATFQNLFSAIFTTTDENGEGRFKNLSEIFKPFTDFIAGLYEKFMSLFNGNDLPEGEVGEEKESGGVFGFISDLWERLKAFLAKIAGESGGEEGKATGLLGVILYIEHFIAECLDNPDMKRIIDAVNGAAWSLFILGIARAVNTIISIINNTKRIMAIKMFSMVNPFRFDNLIKLVIAAGAFILACFVFGEIAQDDKQLQKVLMGMGFLVLLLSAFAGIMFIFGMVQKKTEFGSFLTSIAKLLASLLWVVVGLGALFLVTKYLFMKDEGGKVWEKMKQILTIIAAVLGVMLVIAIAMAALKKFAKIDVGGELNSLAESFEALTKLLPAITGMIAVLAVMSIVLAVADKFVNINKGITRIVVIMGAIMIIVGLMALAVERLKTNQVVAMIATTAILMVGLAALLWMMTKLPDTDNCLMNLIGIAAVIGVIGVVVYALAPLGMAIAPAIVAIGAILFFVYLIINALAEWEKIKLARDMVNGGLAKNVNEAYAQMEEMANLTRKGADDYATAAAEAGQTLTNASLQTNAAVTNAADIQTRAVEGYTDTISEGITIATGDLGEGAQVAMENLENYTTTEFDPNMGASADNVAGSFEDMAERVNYATDSSMIPTAAYSEDQYAQIMENMSGSTNGFADNAETNFGDITKMLGEDGDLMASLNSSSSGWSGLGEIIGSVGSAFGIDPSFGTDIKSLLDNVGGEGGLVDSFSNLSEQVTSFVSGINGEGGALSGIDELKTKATELMDSVSDGSFIQKFLGKDFKTEDLTSTITEKATEVTTGVLDNLTADTNVGEKMQSFGSSLGARLKQGIIDTINIINPFAYLARWLADLVVTFENTIDKIEAKLASFKEKQKALQDEEDAKQQAIYDDMMADQAFVDLRQMGYDADQANLLAEKAAEVASLAGISIEEAVAKVLDGSADQLLAGMVSGLEDGKDDVVGPVQQVANAANTAMEDAEDMHSPSRVWMGYADNMIDGLVNQMAAREKDIIKTAEMVSKKLLIGYKNKEAELNSIGIKMAQMFIDGFKRLNFTYAGEQSASSMHTGFLRQLQNALNIGYDFANMILYSVINNRAAFENAGIFAANAFIDAFNNTRQAGLIAAGVANGSIGLNVGIKSTADISTKSINGLTQATRYTTNLAGISADIAETNRAYKASMDNKAIYSDKNVISAIGGLQADVKSLQDSLSGIGVYIDGKALVGRIAPGIDNSLGQTQSIRRRGSL